MEEDPFDRLLDLEDTFYNEGYELGVADGARAGLIEGRVFGLEKGFEKFIDMGRLHGRSVIWAGRLSRTQNSQQQIHVKEPGKTTDNDVQGDPPPFSRSSKAQRDDHSESSPSMLPLLSDNMRLEKHIRTLYALTEPESLSTQNNEGAVSDFDDRLKRAQAKAKIIEKSIGEGAGGNDGHQPEIGILGSALPFVRAGNADNSIEEVNILKARH